MSKVKSVLGIVIEGEKLLLIKRRDVPVWVLPGGGIEEGESAEQAIVREMWEETGLEVEVTRRVGTYTGGFFIKPVHLYECKLINGSPLSGDEVADVRYFPRDDLPRAVPPPFEEFIDDSFKKIPPFEREITSITVVTIILTLLKHPILFIRFILSRLGLHINSR